MAILSIGELLDLGNSAATAGLVPYSALEYNASGDISGISGSAIAGGVDTTIVSSIASSYVESGVSGKADQSALEDCCSAMSAVVSAKLDASASSQFQQSGNYQPSGDYYSATNPSGFITTADITGKLDTTASSLFQPSGDYADASSLSGKLDASASGMFAPSGDYQSAGDYAYNSSLSSKLDASASSQFAPSGDYVFNSSYSSFTGNVTNNISSISSIVSGITGDWSSKADESALSSYVNYSAISGNGGKITSINGSGISAQAVPTLPLYVASPLTAGIDEMSSQVTIGLSAGAFQPSGSYVSSDTFTAYTASTTPVQVVATSAEATGSNIVYIVTAEP